MSNCTMELLWGRILTQFPAKFCNSQRKEVFRPMEGNPSQCWILDFRHWTPNSLSENLDSRFQSFVRFRIHRTIFWIPWTAFRIPKPRISYSISMADFRIPDSTSKNVLNSGIRTPLHGVREAIASANSPKAECKSTKHRRSLTLTP